MKKMIRILSLVLVVCTLAGMLMLPAQAASTASWSSLGISASNTIKCYLKGTSNATTYTSTTLSTKSGSVYTGDEITVRKIGQNSSGTWYAYINYPLTSTGGTKNAYIALSYLTASTTAGTKKTATAKISTIYRRAATTVYTNSYISKGDTVYVDTVYVLGTSGSYTQVLYNISTGWKMAWIKTTAANSYLSTGSNTTSSTSSATASKLAEIALAEVGYQGTNSKGKGTGDYTKYATDLGFTDGLAWCATFVSWCVKKAGVSTKIVPKTASTLTMAKNSSSYNTWSSSAIKSLKKGDVIFFSKVSKKLESNGSKVVDHVGIVYSVDTSNNKITLIEGNTSADKVAKNTYTVTLDTGAIKNYSGHYFCGYISV